MKKNRYIAIIFNCFFLLNCQSSKSKKIKVVNEVPEHFDMYKTSEMASLMRLMLAENQKLRQQIIDGTTIGDFNEDYLKVHTAKLTNNDDLDKTYPTFANYFIKMQKDIYEVAESGRKAQFNQAVDACIACHQDRCAGPIPRIQKLKID